MYFPFMHLESATRRRDTHIFVCKKLISINVKKTRVSSNNKYKNILKYSVVCDLNLLNAGKS